MRKKKRKPNLFQKFFSWLFILLSAILTGSIIVLNVLDLMHLCFVILVLAFMCFVVVHLVKKRKVFGYFLGVILGAILLFLTINVGKTVSFLNGLELDYKTYHYSVVVLGDSDYQKLRDISNKKLGFYDDGSKEMEKALAKIKKKVEVEAVSYDDTHQLSNSLIDSDIDAMLIENTYLDILDESIVIDGITFKSLVRKIYEFAVLTKTSDISKDINVTKKPFNIYISGIDTYGEISSVSRSDVNMIITVNPTTQQILFTSIPRDYYVKLHGRSGYKDKLTHAGLYGIDMSIHTLEDLLDTEINYYVKVNFTSVVKIVNAIDGVRVYSDYDFTSVDNYHYNKGYNDLNGEEALSFARERKAFATGDRQRIKNQQALLSAIFDKVISKEIITKYSKLLDSASGLMVTNMKMSRMTALVRLQLAKSYSWNLVMNSLNGEDSSNYTYSAPSVKSYVMEPSDTSVSYAHDLILKVLNGEVLDKNETDNVVNKSSTVTSYETGKDTRSIENSNSLENNSSTSKNNVRDQNNFQVQLGRNSVQFFEGDTYVYYGYTATYQGNDVTKSSDLTERFTINGKNFDDYKELVLYISRLSAGEYTVIYTITYREESVKLKQNVLIEKISANENSLKDIELEEDNYVDLEDVD